MNQRTRTSQICSGATLDHSKYRGNNSGPIAQCLEPVRDVVKVNNGALVVWACVEGIERGDHLVGCGLHKPPSQFITLGLVSISGWRPVTPHTHLARAPHIRSPGNWLACFTQSAN